MEVLAIVGSILLGISVISGLVKSGEVGGCFGVFLVIGLILILVLVGLAALLVTVGGQIL